MSNGLSEASLLQVEWHDVIVQGEKYEITPPLTRLTVSGSGIENKGVEEE